MNTSDDSDSITPVDMSKQYYEILKQNKKLQKERDHFQRLLLDKEKKILHIENQLQGLKRKIHHHKSVWLQIAEDNKLLKKEIFNAKQTPSLPVLHKKLNSLIEKTSLGEKAFSQQRTIENLLKNKNYLECLNQVVEFMNEYIEEYSEKELSYAKRFKEFNSYSIGPGISPIYHEGITDDDEIDKLMDESKILLQTLEKQNIKLNSLNERIGGEFRIAKSYS